MRYPHHKARIEKAERQIVTKLSILARKKDEVILQQKVRKVHKTKQVSPDVYRLIWPDEEAVKGENSITA